MPALPRRRLLKQAFLWTVSGVVRCAQTQSAFARPVAADEISARERAAMAATAEGFRTKYGVPGLSVAIARKGRSVYEQAFGVAALAPAAPLAPGHVFRIASVTKPITSSAIFDLVETGRLKLEDRVFGQGAVLGTRFGRTPYGRHIEEITVEHLLTHTCGGWQNDARDPMFRNPGMAHAELISWTLDSIPLTSPPGQSFAYSNFGYCLLGRVIEQVTGRSYAEHVQERVLARCGIRHMSLAGNTLRDRAPAEVRYYGQSGENPYGMNVRRMDSHGGWLATAGDLTAFAMHVDGFITTPHILRAETIGRMTTPTPANRGYAKGWRVNSLNNWWHGGSLPGTATILVRTASGFCWAALANTRRPNSDMDEALDNMVWDMVRSVGAWRR
jgi:CubicO group peptidase (beta-lactamase class C family)